MEILLNREKGMKAVDVARNFAGGASGINALQGVLLSAEAGRVRLTTTDLAVWCQVELEAEISEPGTVVVPARSLATILKTLPESRVLLRSTRDDLVCEAGASEMRLSGIDPEEFPEVEEPEGCRLSLPLTAALIDRVAYAVSRDDTRYTLTGVLLEVESRRLKLLATNGQRLARYTGGLPPGSACDGDEPVQAIVPARLLNDGVRLGAKLRSPATFELYEKAAAVQINESVRIWAGLIEGPYPDYERAVPSAYTATVSVPTGALSSAVARLAALSKGRRTPGLLLRVEDSCLVLSLLADAGDGIAAVEKVTPARSEGTVPSCRLRIGPLSDALARLPDLSWVDVKFSDDAGPVSGGHSGPGDIRWPACWR